MQFHYEFILTLLYENQAAQEKVFWSYCAWKRNCFTDSNFEDFLIISIPNLNEIYLGAISSTPLLKFS